MPIGLNEGNVGRTVCPGFRKSTYGSSFAKTSETILETAHCRDCLDLDVSHRTSYVLLPVWFFIPLAQQLCNEHFPTLHEKR